MRKVLGAVLAVAGAALLYYLGRMGAVPLAPPPDGLGGFIFAPLRHTDLDRMALLLGALAGLGSGLWLLWTGDYEFDSVTAQRFAEILDPPFLRRRALELAALANGVAGALLVGLAAGFAGRWEAALLGALVAGGLAHGLAGLALVVFGFPRDGKSQLLYAPALLLSLLSTAAVVGLLSVA